MKSLTRTLLAVLAIAAILGLWEWAGSPYFGLGVRTPFESAAAYHLRMMYYHGRETKDGQDSLHGDQLVALGDRAVPVLAEAVGWGFNPRFDPKPHEMLACFPDAAHGELQRTIRNLKESPDSAPAYRHAHFLNRRINLTTALILVSNDWTYLDSWLADVQEHPEHPSYGDDAVRLMRDMLQALLVDESAPEPFQASDSWDRVTISPAFLAWWQENGRRIAAAENREGFRNARGWKSSRYRDRIRADEP